MAKIQKIFNISFVLNKKVLILFNTMNGMNKISTILFVFPQLAVFRFLSWLYFISSVGCILFPQLAVFYFLSWLYFVSSVG